MRARGGPVSEEEEGGGGVVGGGGGGRRRKRARNAHACGMQKSKQATEQGLGMIVGKMGKQGV